jgi:hypothetical protein
VKWANEFFPGPRYVLGKIEDSPWLGRFDAIVSLETIEHLKDPSKVLKVFRESCAGRFIVSVPNEERYPFVAENFVNDESPHYRHYTPGEFQSLLENHGFTVLEKHCQVSKHKPQVIEGTEGMFLIYVCR